MKNIDESKEHEKTDTASNSELSDLLSVWISIANNLPKSGQRVIFFWRTNELKYARTSVGFYAQKGMLEASGEWVEEWADIRGLDDTYVYPEGWYEEGWEIENQAQIDNVTHWMELPAEPDR